MAKSGKGADKSGGGKEKGTAPKGKGKGKKGKGGGKKAGGDDGAVARPKAPRASILERLALLVAVLFVLALAVQQLPA